MNANVKANLKLDNMYVRRILFIFGILGSISFAVITGSRFPYLLAIVMVMLFVSMILIIRSNKKNLYHFFYLSNERTEVGQELGLEFKLTNTGVMPISRAKVTCIVSKKLGDMAFPDEVIFMKPFQLVNLKKRFVCKHRGFYQVGKIEVIIKDPFGLFEKKIVFDKQINLIVYPRIHPVEYMKIPATDFFGTIGVNNSSHEDFSSLKKVRKYTYGDSIKRVHWKLSSKYNELYIKEFDLTASTKTTIFIDGFKEQFSSDNNHNIEERLVEVTASVIKYTLNSKIETNLIYNTNGRNQIEGRDSAKLENFLMALIAFAPVGEVALEALVTIEAKRLSTGSTMILVTTEITPGLFNAIIGLAKRQFKILLMIVEGESDPEDETHQMRIDVLRETGVSIRRFREKANIKQVLEEY